MTPEVISVIITGAALAATIFGGLYRLFTNLKKDLVTSFDARFDTVDPELQGVHKNIVDLQISVARIEGSPPALLRGR